MTAVRRRSRPIPDASEMKAQRYASTPRGHTFGYRLPHWGEIAFDEAQDSERNHDYGKAT
jgi:hypothetical protein